MIVTLKLAQRGFSLLRLESQTISVKTGKNLSADDIVTFFNENFPDFAADFGDNSGIGISLNWGRTGIRCINIAAAAIPDICTWVVSVRCTASTAGNKIPPCRFNDSASAACARFTWAVSTKSSVLRASLKVMG